MLYHNWNLKNEMTKKNISVTINFLMISRRSTSYGSFTSLSPSFTFTFFFTISYPSLPSLPVLGLSSSLLPSDCRFLSVALFQIINCIFLQILTFVLFFVWSGLKIIFPTVHDDFRTFSSTSTTWFVVNLNFKPLSTCFISQWCQEQP